MRRLMRWCVAACVAATVAAAPAGAAVHAPVRGPDVSNNNGCGIHWGLVRAAGDRFAFVKATEGTGFRDRCFPGHWRQLAYYGFVRGAYSFAHLDQSPRAGAHAYCSYVNASGGLKDGIAVLDVEAHSGGNVFRNRAWVTTWIAVVRLECQPGKVLVYTAPFFWNPQLGCWTPAGAGLWVATYGRAPAIPCGWGGWDFWQFTDGQVGPFPHTVPGIGNTDISVFSGDLATLLTYTVGVIPQKTYASRPIRIGTRGTDVRYLQRKVNGFLTSSSRRVAVDGQYGQATERAKRRAECKLGWPDATRRWAGVGVRAQNLLAHPDRIPRSWHRRRGC